MEVDDGGRWNVVDNSYNGDTWLSFMEKNNKTSLYCPDDALICLYRDSIIVFFSMKRNQVSPP